MFPKLMQSDRALVFFKPLEMSLRMIQKNLYIHLSFFLLPHLPLLLSHEQYVILVEGTPQNEEISLFSFPNEQH
jgi:hypothetical protein